jgi:PIN domain nuclease of toxin-antitoxin system
MIIAVADTHAAIWYLSQDSHLSESARSFMDNAASTGDEVAVSAITLIEMIYLIEKGRIPPQRFTEPVMALNTSASMFVEIPVDLSIARTLARVDAAQVPDMPDRIVAATALQFGVPVISRDRKIVHSNIQTIW